jgi:hypothetical protein
MPRLKNSIRTGSSTVTFGIATVFWFFLVVTVISNLEKEFRRPEFVTYFVIQNTLFFTAPMIIVTGSVCYN